MRGTILDSATQTPIQYASVEAFNGEDKIIQGVLTDSLGDFVIRIDSSVQGLRYTAVGYKSKLIAFSPTPRDSTMILPVIYLSRDNTQLAGVTVTGTRPAIESRVDGFVYNTELDVPLTGGNATDLLRKVPFVSITPDGTPSVRGSTNIRVFIDNKPSFVYANTIAEALQVIPSGDIAQIEVITHPSSRFDGEGSDAVINIITKKRRYNGFNGELRGTLGNWMREMTTSLKLRSGYWIVNADAGLYRSDYAASHRILRATNKYNPSDRFEQQRRWDSRQHTRYAALTIIRILDSLRSLNVGYRYRKSSSLEQTVHETQLYTTNNLTDAFTRDLPTAVTNGVHTVSAGYTGISPDKKQELNLLATMFDHSGTDAYDMQQFRNNIVDYRENSRGTSGNQEFTFQGDYVRHFSKQAKLESGFKGTWRGTSANSHIDVYNSVEDKFIVDTFRSNLFDFQRNVYAFYATYHHTIHRWQWRIGGRMERTTLHATFKDSELKVPNFNNVLPNILTKYTINPKMSVAYSYGTRITRPYTFYLNPNVNYADSFNLTYGNPTLDPEVSHIHTWDYGYTSRIIFAGVSVIHTRIRGAIDQVRIVRPDRVSETTYRNVSTAANWSLSATARFNYQNKLTLGTTVTATHVHRESPSLNLVAKGWLGQLSFNGSYKFGKGFSVQSYVYFETGSINLQQQRSHYLFYNLLVSKKTARDRLNITARFDGFFKPWFYRTTTIDNSSFYQTTTARDINRYLRLAISWKFGKQDLRTPVARTTESSD